MRWLLRNWFYAACFAAAVAAAFKWIVVDWVVLALLTLAGFPVWWRTIVAYIGSVEHTPDGLRVRFRQDLIGKDAAVVETLSATQGPSLTAPAQKTPFEQLSIHARRILKALYFNQISNFPEGKKGRWGFGVSEGAPNYEDFMAGVRELQWDRRIAIDQRGLVYLTTDGLEFCKQHQDFLAKEPAYYKEFTPASPA